MALIPPAYLNSVVSIGVEKKNDKNEPEFKSLATGFLIGKAVDEKNEQGQQSYRLFLVTNRHVFYNQKTKEYVKVGGSSRWKQENLSSVRDFLV